VAGATEHQAVLGSVAAVCDVLPFRIPGMYAEESRLIAVLETERELLTRGLEAVRDHVEWGVQVFLSDRPDAEPAPRPRSGRDYLRHRSEQAGSRERAADERRDRVLAAYGTIADASTHSVANPPQDPALSKRREPMLLNSAHLVPRNREEPFFAVLREVQEELRASGMVVEVSGPWPPYNFVHLAAEELNPSP
jgi:gas vesicle protein GvpL/GvpF